MSFETVLDRHIEITAGVAGGKPRIAGHRITVQNVVIWHEWMGLSADEIATTFQLTLTDIYAALAYYYSHQAEIDNNIERGQEFITALKEQIPTKIKESKDVG